MTYKDVKQRRVDALATVLTETFDAVVAEQGDLRNVRLIAERLVNKDVQLTEYAEWVKDESYTGLNKEVYRCSRCDHWQAVKKVQADKVIYMKYCPFCGARMIDHN